MKRILILSLITFLLNQYLLAQKGAKEIQKEKKDVFIEKESGITDRAAGLHNASNIGLFFENRGKLYPRRLSQGPSGEYPINSGKHYIYRINPYVGVPNNVVQGRFTTNEEWEAVGGYHNNEYARVATSDNPKTWHPTNGWPIKDAEGNPIIKSDQDTYCAYDDFNNTRQRLGVQVAQTGYTYGVKFAQNIIFFKFEITNHGDKDLDSLYFALYCDIDVGNVSGGIPEYADDKIGFDKAKNFLYFYDSKGYSAEWPDGKTGYFGVAFLRTPKINGQEVGISDMHYNLYDDDQDIDSLLYGIMSSSRSIYNSNIGAKYFHLGQSSDIHFDDPNTIPPTGLDIVATLSSGPYKLTRTDTLVFYTAIIAGENLADAMQTLDQAYKILDFDFEIAKPPATPSLTAYPGDRKAILFWDDKAESSKDKFTNQYDFEGYRVYRTLDKGINWELIADFDLPNKIGLNKGLQYSYVDTTVINGIEYWYSVTAYDRGDSLIESLESPLGKDTNVINTKSVIPRSDAVGRVPVSSDTVAYIGRGKSNYVLKVNPVDDERLGNREYEVKFGYIPRTEIGTLRTKATITITDSTRTKPYRYGIQFKSPKTFDLINLFTGDFVRENYAYVQGGTYTVDGLRIKLEDPDPNAPPEFLPKAGDYITINYAVNVVRNNKDTVLYPRPFSLGKPYSTSDGVVFTLVNPEVIKNVSRIGGTDKLTMTFSVFDTTKLLNKIYLISTNKSGFNQKGEGFVGLLIRGSTLMDTVKIIDTLYNLQTFDFNGVRGKIEFQSSNPPGAGNIFSLETIMPVIPNIQDAYKFKILGSKIYSPLGENPLNKIKVVPNPYVVSSLYEIEYGELRREPLRQIQFINLPSECTIHIFTLDGDLIKTLYHNSTNGTETWDLRAEGGREISTGIYLYVVKSASSEFLNRFAVIK